MSLLSRKKGRRVSRFSAVIAIIGAAVSACEKKLPKEESNYFSKLGHTVQVQLEEGNIDEKKIRELVTIYTEIKNNTNIKIFIPQKLERGIYYLGVYYARWHYIESEKKEAGDGLPLLARLNITYECSLLLEQLLLAEKYLGIKLLEERAQLKELLKLVKRENELRDMLAGKKEFITTREKESRRIKISEMIKRIEQL